MTVKMRESQSHHARQLLDAAQALNALLPKATSNGARPNTRVAGVPVEFLEQCAVFFDENPAIAMRLAVTSDQVRTVIARTAALGPVVAAIEPMARQLRAVMNQDRAAIGSLCLKAYDYAKSSARTLGDASLGEQAARMHEALRWQKRSARNRAQPNKVTKLTTTTTTTSSEPAASRPTDR